jgi:hypothetical protein
LAIYGHQKSKNSQLSILQNQIAHLLEPTFCYVNFKIAFITRIVKQVALRGFRSKRLIEKKITCRCLMTIIAKNK